jgi:RNA polymerase-binding transcription factor DksA
MDTTAQHALRLLASRREALARHAHAALDTAAALSIGAGQPLPAHEERELREIDAAINRILNGTWGACEKCGGAVGRDRLRTLPEVRYCAYCAP